jgi:hypothetical protein
MGISMSNLPKTETPATVLFLTALQALFMENV